MKAFFRLALSTSLTVAASTAVASPAADAFESIKALAGTWDVATSEGPAGQVTYEVASDGSVVIERLFGMMTTYYVDGDALMAVHYCSAHNQPRLKAVDDAGADHANFELVDVGSLHNPNDGHMARLQVRFVDADHFTQAWTWRENGVDTAPEQFSYTRRAQP